MSKIENIEIEGEFYSVGVLREDFGIWKILKKKAETDKAVLFQIAKVTGVIIEGKVGRSDYSNDTLMSIWVAKSQIRDNKIPAWIIEKNIHKDIVTKEEFEQKFQEFQAQYPNVTFKLVPKIYPSSLL